MDFQGFWYGIMQCRRAWKQCNPFVTRPTTPNQRERSDGSFKPGKQEAQATPVTHHAHDTSGISSSHRPWAYSSHARFTILAFLVNIHRQCQPSPTTLRVQQHASTPCGTGSNKLEPRLRQHKPHDSIRMSSSTADQLHRQPIPPPSATSHLELAARPTRAPRVGGRANLDLGGFPKSQGMRIWHVLRESFLQVFEEARSNLGVRPSWLTAVQGPLYVSGVRATYLPLALLRPAAGR